MRLFGGCMETDAPLSITQRIVGGLESILVGLGYTHVRSPVHHTLTYRDKHTYFHTTGRLAFICREQPQEGAWTGQRSKQEQFWPLRCHVGQRWSNSQRNGTYISCPPALVLQSMMHIFSEPSERGCTSAGTGSQMPCPQPDLSPDNKFHRRWLASLMLLYIVCPQSSGLSASTVACVPAWQMPHQRRCEWCGGGEVGGRIQLNHCVINMCGWELVGTQRACKHLQLARQSL